jgi:hypothetical protein
MQSPLYQFRLESAPDLAFIVQRPGSDPSAAARGPSEWFMKLRCKPDPARTADVWAEGNPLVCEGEAVTAVRMNARDEEGFAWIRTASGAEGFLRSEYLALAPQRAPQERRTEVLWKAGTTYLLELRSSVPTVAQETLVAHNSNTPFILSISTWSSFARSNCNCLSL